MCKKSLYEQITDPEHIYKAIYSLESFIFERYLLNKSDYDDFIKLNDKYNDIFITKYIKKCVQRIDSIINSDELFNCSVFLKAKKYDKESDLVEFRPIHSASLLDQICMVVMLSVLMFDDTSGIRKLSAISRLLPANFYGNIPSKNVSELFKPWSKQYKEYSTDAISANRNYFENKKFKYELTLDLERFFPSINPVFIYNYILDKWPVNATPNDKEFLSKIVEKLLFFNLDLENELKCYYYPSKLMPINPQELIYNIGIAQGLPQAYFFGNLCMSIIAKHENKLLKGDSYFYVDDSIIYTNEIVNDELIEKLVVDINLEVGKYANAKTLNNISLKHFDKKVQSCYKLKIHSLKGKSEFKGIEKIDSLYFLAKPASPLPFEIWTAQDEFEDISLLGKIEAIIEAINFLIEKTGKEPKNQTELKRLNRYRKFYTNRLNYLKTSQSVDLIYNDEKLDAFIAKFDLNNAPSDSRFFDLLESDVFCFESQSIALQISNEQRLKEKFLHSIIEFELSCLPRVLAKSIEGTLLYFGKVLSTICILDSFPSNGYSSLNSEKIVSGINNKTRTTNDLKIKYISEIIDLVN